VYEHLAQGAEALCPEAFQELRAGLEVPALARGAEAPVAARAEDETPA
jgi:hypothetical protein